jgi:hypothetical protein
MLKNLGKSPLWLRLGQRVFVCMPNSQLGNGMRERIRPFIFGRLACWTDKAS